jgi:hypothetical protein
MRFRTIHFRELRPSSEFFAAVGTVQPDHECGLCRQFDLDVGSERGEQWSEG